MPALNFQMRFADLVKEGKKRQTIRRCRKDGRNIRAGQILFLYTGMRTKNCSMIDEVICKSSDAIIIDRYEHGVPKVFINGDQLDAMQIDELAVEDGFDNLLDFADFFVPLINGECELFRGYLIKW